MFAIFAVFFLNASTAHSYFLIEPYAGYSTVLTDVTLGDAAGQLSGQMVKLDGSGIGFGLRVGFTIPMFFAALDYSNDSLKQSIKEQPAGAGLTTSDQAVTSLGVTLGSDLGLVRPYFGYIFDDKTKDDSSTRYGTGFKLGIGFGFIPKVNVNAEYVTKKITKSKNNSGVESNIEQANIFKSITTSGIFINVSVPLEL